MPKQMGRRTAVVVATVLAGLALAGIALTACSDEATVKDAAPTVAPPTATVQPSPATTPRPWSFHGQRGIWGYFPPADLALYRSLLPTPFDMPDTPLVVMAVVYYSDVTLPLTPYHEGYVLLQCKYQGRTGWYVVTMPVDDAVANAGGLSLGFPKYIADKIDLGDTNGVWSGEVAYQGRSVMQVTFTPQSGSVPMTQSSSDPGLPVFLLIPPGEGPKIDEVNTDLAGDRRTVTGYGTATIAADPGEPWAGLLPAGGTAPAMLQEMTGDDWILVPTVH